MLNKRNQKYMGKYRITSMRLRKYDYSKNGAYFVTICTKGGIHHFGEIMKKETQEIASPHHSTKNKSIVQLSELGNIAEKCWLEIPIHFPFVKLGEFVIMPNHVHGILIFEKLGGNKYEDRDARNCVSTINRNKFGPQSRNLASVIRGFKIGVIPIAPQICTKFLHLFPF